MSDVLHLQDPSVAGLTLLDAIADAAHGAERGGGIFAFASETGIAALLDDSEVRPVANASFELVVGIDAITDTRALNDLTERVAKYHGLRARVLLHGLPALFHPKLCWFAGGDRLTLLVGSGNLTGGGLTSNFEAFAVTRLVGVAAQDIERDITAWLARWQAKLLAPDAPEALARAAKNESDGALRRLRPSRGTPPAAPPVSDGACVAVLEIPKNTGGMRTQIDAGETMFRDYFGGVRGHQKRIQVQHVDAAGTLEEAHTVPWTQPESVNFRFEARAGRRDYPAVGRPIGVFLHMSDGIFRYRLLWPGEPGHAEVDAFLTARAGPSRQNMRRERATAAELDAAWPNSPLLVAAR